ncbi:hypothetical protein BASA60_000324 [Batrachochytrium salamandrivorans]|nr:hypothetical protein BASA62_000270 [Batrachochytrium salamandrivorans]KAH6560403.1 hypothetical protein BASA60_000324 [Batrachochytrium salamandrivorans]
MRDWNLQLNRSIMSGATGVQKVLLKIRRSVQDGNYYEAHQMYHSVCQRLIKQKKVDDAVELLYSGILNMLEHSQTGSAIDLTERLLEVYDRQHLPLTDSSRACLVDVFSAFPLDSTECEQFSKLCSRWSAKHQESPFGDPQLQHVFGYRYFKNQKYYDAESHFIYGNIDSSKALGYMAAEWASVDEEMDSGYPIARAVLQLLAIGKLDDAKAALATFLKTFLESRPAIVTSTQKLVGRDLPIFSSGYLNFSQLAIECIDRQAGDLFINLMSFYQALLSEDGFLLQLAEMVAGAYFNTGPRKKQINPLMDMMKGLFSGPAAPQQISHISEMD